MRIKMRLKEWVPGSLFTWHDELNIPQILLVTPNDILDFNILENGEVELITTISDFCPIYQLEQIEKTFEPIYKYETTITMDKPKGMWTKEKRKYKCNHCFNKVKKPTNFCPNCGRDMRESQI